MHRSASGWAKKNPALLMNCQRVFPGQKYLQTKNTSKLKLKIYAEKNYSSPNVKYFLKFASPDLLLEDRGSASEFGLQSSHSSSWKFPKPLMQITILLLLYYLQM